MPTPSFDLPQSFSGVVRLFPLPNLVLFPGVVQGLHLFEPRYLQLIEDSLMDDELITMALSMPDKENLSRDVPEIFPTVCIGKVMTHAKLEDGQYNLLLAGMRRARIVQELDVKTAYRQAEVQLVEDIHDAAPSDAILRKKLLDEFLRHKQLDDSFDKESVKHLLSDEIELGQLADLICYASGVPVVEQQSALSMADVLRRVQLVLNTLSALPKSSAGSGKSGSGKTGGDEREFPPDFSLN